MNHSNSVNSGVWIINKWLSKWFPWISHESVEKTHKQSQTHNLNQSDDYSVNKGVSIHCNESVRKICKRCQTFNMNHSNSVNSGVWIMNKWLSKWFPCHESVEETHKQSQTHNLNQSNDYSGVWFMNKWLSNRFTVMNQSKRLTKSLKLTIWISLMTTVWTVQSDSRTNDSLNDSLVMNQSKTHKQSQTHNLNQSNDATLIKIKVSQGFFTVIPFNYWFPKEPFSEQFLKEPYFFSVWIF